MELNKLQKNTKEHLISNLDYFASKSEQIGYKKNVPFVHIPIELFNQWESLYKIKHNWFKDIWSESQLEALNYFDIDLKKLSNKLPKNIPDVPEILDNKIWNEIMLCATNTLKKIKTVANT